ncbi:hypothetical protein AB0I84_07650, partial [Streptomyces spectabilis]
MPEQVELDWAYLSRLADRVAHTIAQKRSIVEAADVKQEILLHAYEHRSAIEANYTNEDFLWKIFNKAGTQYASKERNYRDLLDDAYYYTPDEAKRALETFLYTDDELSQFEPFRLLCRSVVRQQGRMGQCPRRLTQRFGAR